MVLSAGRRLGIQVTSSYTRYSTRSLCIKENDCCYSEKMADKTASPVVAAATVNAAATATPKKAAKTAKASSNKPIRPKTSEMVNAAITALKERRGSSAQAIKKYIASTYKLDGEKQATFIKKYLKAAVASGALVQTKGKGAAGSFRLSAVKETSKPKVKSAVTKSPVAKKATAAKKPVAAKKPAGTVTKKVVAKKTVAAASEKKKVTKGPAAKPPKAKTTKAKPTAKSPVKKAKAVSPKKTKPAVAKPKKAAPKKTAAKK